MIFSILNHLFFSSLKGNLLQLFVLIPFFQMNISIGSLNIMLFPSLSIFGSLIFGIVANANKRLTSFRVIKCVPSANLSLGHEIFCDLGATWPFSFLANICIVSNNGQEFRDLTWISSSNSANQKQSFIQIAIPLSANSSCLSSKGSKRKLLWVVIFPIHHKLQSSWVLALWSFRR